MISIAISGTGLYTPAESISNAELVQAYNEYVRRYNAAHHEAIAADAMPPLLKSSDEFIFKASGIHRRHVLSREGMLDPEVMCPRLPERPNEEHVAFRRNIDHRGAPGAGSGTPNSRGYRWRDRRGVDPAAALSANRDRGSAGPRHPGFGFDMLAGCSSATFGIQTAADMIARGHARAILCINPEICTSHLNLRDRETHFIFGDAATACVLERVNRPTVTTPGRSSARD